LSDWTHDFTGIRSEVLAAHHQSERRAEKMLREAGSAEVVVHGPRLERTPDAYPDTHIVSRVSGKSSEYRVVTVALYE
jgi:L-2-hydroxyglutarate oxidase LhgO